MTKKAAPKKADQSLLSSAKQRKKILEREAAKLRKEVNKLTEGLYELQNKITLLDQLIDSEGPKKRKLPVKTVQQSGPASAAGRTPAAVKKH